MVKPQGRRARQAQDTHDEILRAARTLFAQHGYSGTTVREIAAAAGVSAQTVYDSVGSKQALVARLNDLIDEEARVGTIVGEAMASDEATQLVKVQARITRSILESCGDIVHALVTGAASEPELAEVLAEGHRRHLDGARQIIHILQERDELAPEMEPDAAADNLAALADLRLALLLRDTYGWSLDRIEAWVSDVSARLLLAP